MQTSILKRARLLKDVPYPGGPIVYWMNRDQRTADNWALLFAQAWAREQDVPLLVVHNLVPNFLQGGARQWSFKVRGLQEVEKRLHEHHIPFIVYVGKDSHKEMAKELKVRKIGGLVTDFFPLRASQAWLNDVKGQLTIPIYQVDAHNIVPCWVASQKQEFSARTIRPKIHAHLPEYLTDIPCLKKQPVHPFAPHSSSAWEQMLHTASVHKTPEAVNWIEPGEQAAHKALRAFIKYRLPAYAEKRNDPLENALSDLSPYFHFGHLSPQRVAWEVSRADIPKAAKDAYLEELIIRRELSDNYCYYQPQYDTFAGLPHWAQVTLEEHRHDPRPYIYTKTQLEKAQTHDDLWNAAQQQMVKTGKMHGYLRMYWAKKILEWTKTPEDALEVALFLNDRYELDGRDPNGYVGVAWSIGGLHDRPWFNRPIFGSVRYMSRTGCEKKFDTDAYINRWVK